jgi:uncharacterized membrane-anchored protein YitT (DUF2179 family)
VTTMDNKTIEKWVWILIYGGLLVLSLGLFVLRQDAAFGRTLIAGGAAGVVLGALLIWIRSRRGP